MPYEFGDPFLEILRKIAFSTVPIVIFHFSVSELASAGAPCLGNSTAPEERGLLSAGLSTLNPGVWQRKVQPTPASFCFFS
jgi:hypothetical protein